MQLHHDRPDYEFSMRGADGSYALVNERRLTASFILSPNILVESWPVHDVRTLTPGDLEPLFALQPELILLGCGKTQAFPSPATMAASLSRGIGMETMTNAATARTFNVLASENRRVVAGFIITG